jgi:hypothetical protein
MTSCVYKKLFKRCFFSISFLVSSTKFFFTEVFKSSSFFINFLLLLILPLDPILSFTRRLLLRDRGSASFISYLGNFSWKLFIFVIDSCSFACCIFYWILCSNNFFENVDSKLLLIEFIFFSELYLRIEDHYSFILQLFFPYTSASRFVKLQYTAFFFRLYNFS